MKRARGTWGWGRSWPFVWLRHNGGVATGGRFFEQVYALVRTVPYGRVITYGAVARILGAPTRAREVGWALASLSDDHDVPAHRVVNAQGALSGGWAFGGPHVQRALLQAEGVRFDSAGRVDLDRFLWFPNSS